MSKIAIVSNKILSIKHNEPITGVVLVNGEYIEDVIEVPAGTNLTEISLKYSDWNPMIFPDTYICPGMIDLAVKSEWESLETITQLAVSGGFTLILQESNLFNADSQIPSNVFCEIGTIASVNSIENNLPKNVYALKGYLYPPSSQIKSTPMDFSYIANQLIKLNVPLFIDPILPPDRLLFQVSPCRHLPLSERLNYKSDDSLDHFSGAFPDEIKSDQSSEGEEIPVPVTEKRHSTGASNLPLPPLPRCQAKRKSEWPISSLQDRRASVNDIHDELDKRIRKNKHSLASLTALELGSYQGSGITIADPLRNRSASYNFETPENSAESPVEKPRSFLENRSIRCGRPAPLKISIEPPKMEEQKYVSFLAKIPEKWESSGIKTLLSHLEGLEIKVHFTKLSAASAINRIRKQKNKNYSCDVPCHVMYFDDSEIPDGCSEFKDFPPIRTKTNKLLLWDLLKYNSISAIASHHSSILTEFKRINRGSFIESLSGINSIGYVLQAVWTKIKQQEINESLDNYIFLIFKWLSLHPAKILNISHLRGSIEKGKYADFCIWRPFELNTMKVKPAVGQSVFKDHQLFGNVVCTIVQGQVVYYNGEFSQIR